MRELELMSSTEDECPKVRRSRTRIPRMSTEEKGCFRSNFGIEDDSRAGLFDLARKSLHASFSFTTCYQLLHTQY